MEYNREVPRSYSFEEVKQRIIDALRQSESGLSGIEIAEKTGINRVTVTKYLNILETMGIIRRRSMGPVNIWYIQHGVDLSSKDLLELQQAYMDVLFAYDEDRARTLLLNAIHSNIDPMLLISDVVIPTVNTAGELYARGRMGAMDIMLVTNLAIESLELIKFNAERGEIKRDAHAVFMSMHEDGRDVIDMKAASIAFYIKGWNTFPLGNVAQQTGIFFDIDIIRFINRIWRDRGRRGMVVLYISPARGEIATLNELIRSVKEKLERSMLVIAGGKALDRPEGREKDGDTDKGMEKEVTKEKERHGGRGGDLKDAGYAPYIDYYAADVVKAVEWAERMYRSLRL